MKPLLGKPLADGILAGLKHTIEHSQITPGLAVLLVGNDPASEIYVGLKEKAARALGIRFERHVFASDTSPREILTTIDALNRNPSIHGIIIQLPLPEPFDESHLVNALSPDKDADGFHQDTLKHFFSGALEAEPVFPRAITHLIRSTGEEVAGKEAVVIANSEVFGQVMKRSLENLGLRTTLVLRQAVQDASDVIQKAKVVVVACGEPGLVESEMIAPGTIVIDGGITRVGERVLGDVDPAGFEDRPGWLTPVPGGVGPMTVAMLLARVTELALNVKEKPRVVV